MNSSMRVSVSVGALVAATVFLLIAWIPSTTLLTIFFFDGRGTFWSDVSNGAQLLALSVLEFTPSNLAFAIVTAVFIGVYAGLLSHHYARRGLLISHTSGALGAIIGLIGVGCAACGYVPLLSLLSALGGTSLAAALPFSDKNVAIVGIILLAYANISLWFALRHALYPVKK